MKLKKVAAFLTEEGKPYLKEEVTKYMFDNRRKFNHPECIADFARELDIASYAFECVYAFFLDQADHILSFAEISKGGIRSTCLPVREIVQAALLTGACNVIILHNHPSGDLTPSREDIEGTARLKSALQICDLVLLDHIIISRHGYLSMQRCDLIT